ncbi:MAG: homocysteine S-methyltransferase family protein [Pseudomonadota bacterium]
MTDEVTILDGGMGQELIHRSPDRPTPLWGTRVMVDYPNLVREIHDAYFAAGAKVATTNTYALLRDRTDKTDLRDRFADLHEIACRIAVESRDAHGSGIVAGAMGPLVASYLADAGPPREEAAAAYREIARIQAPLVDVFLAETVPSRARARATLDGLEGEGKPVWLAVTVGEEDGRVLRSGEPVTDILDDIAGRDVAALLVNCSSPEAVTQAVAELSGAPVRFGAYANGFRPIPEAFKKPGATVDILSQREDLTPEVYADFAEEWVRLGATIVGGCCEVGPAHIAELSHRLNAKDTSVDRAATRA